MARWLVAALILGACGSGSVSLDEYPDAFRDAYCRYLARCGAFPDVATCKKADIGIHLHIDPSTQAEVDMGKVVFDEDAAARCLDAFGAQSCDTTDKDSRALPAECNSLAHGTVPAGEPCAENGECDSDQCDIPACSMSCCQGTCSGSAAPPPGGPGTACALSSDCASGSYCDFNATSPVCTLLKSAGATCQSSNECAYGLGCAGTTAHVCKALPTLGEPCPDGVCRDAGNYCDAQGTCSKIGLAGVACTSNSACSPFYPCNLVSSTCEAGPSTGQPCAMGDRCFDADTFCDASQPQPVCTHLLPDGAVCGDDSQCESDHCDPTGNMCGEAAVCI